MLMNRDDINGRGAIVFEYHEVQGSGPYGQWSHTNGKVTRCYDIPIPQPGFDSPADAWTKIRKAFLGYADLSNDGRYVSRLTPLTDPTDTTCFFTAITRLEPFPFISVAPGGR